MSGKKYSIADVLRQAASKVSDEYGNSGYPNLPTYHYPATTQNEPGTVPESTKEGPDTSEDKQKKKRKDEMMMPGERPLVDSLTIHVLPVTTTNIGEAKENEQGEAVNDTTTPEGRNENRDTIGFDPGTLTTNPFGD